MSETAELSLELQEARKDIENLHREHHLVREDTSNTTAELKASKETITSLEEELSAQAKEIVELEEVVAGLEGQVKQADIVIETQRMEIEKFKESYINQEIQSRENMKHSEEEICQLKV